LAHIATAGEFHERRVSVAGMDVGIGTERGDHEFTDEEARERRERRSWKALL
jgi:hypothetical protein